MDPRFHYAVHCLIEQGVSPTTAATIVSKQRLEDLPYPPPPPLPRQRLSQNAHMVHLVLTLFTCGLWSPIWIIHAVIGTSGGTS